MLFTAIKPSLISPFVVSMIGSPVNWMAVNLKAAPELSPI